MAASNEWDTNDADIAGMIADHYAEEPDCPCGFAQCRPGYRLCWTCLEIAGASGLNVEVYRS